MNIIDYHQGCGIRPGCFGPKGDFYTIFGTELNFLLGHAILSLIFSFGIFMLLLNIKERSKIKIPYLIVAILSIFLFELIFLSLAYLFPIRFDY